MALLELPGRSIAGWLWAKLSAWGVEPDAFSCDLMAEISAGTVICMGRVEGTVMASNKVEIHSTSKVVGNVKF